MAAHRNRWLKWLLLVLVLAFAAAAVYFGVRYRTIQRATDLSADYADGEWIELAPEGIVSANGTPVTSRMRLGAQRENVIVLFHGGGVSINEYTASHPYTTTNFFYEDGFYAPDTTGIIPELCELGIGSPQEDNPFRDWTIVIIPYTTGDYHIGAGDYAYTDEDGNEQLLHHHGYTNFRAVMDEAIRYIDEVESLLIAGNSAGGFGAAMLAEDLIEDYFPDAENITLCIDSAIQLYEDWAGVASQVWNAPDKFTNRMQTRNLIVDFLSSLYDTYGDRITYLYVGSTRDAVLARYQAYLNGAPFSVRNEQGRLYVMTLLDTIGLLREKVPTIGIYLFDSVPYSLRPDQFILTQHTVICTNMFFWPLTEYRSVADWLMSAVQGDVKDHGLTLFGKKQSFP